MWAQINASSRYRSGANRNQMPFLQGNKLNQSTKAEDERIEYMEKKEYLYMKRWKDLVYVVAFQLGAYYVAVMAAKNSGVMLVPFGRKYKTVSGASNFLERLQDKNADGSEPETFYGTEEFIKKGTFWKGEK